MGIIILIVISFGIGFAVKYFIGNYLGVPILDLIIGFIVGGYIFVFGAPIVFISGLIDDKINHVQDREDLRQFMRDIPEEEPHSEHDIYKDYDIDEDEDHYDD